MLVYNSVCVENSCQAVVGWVFLCTQSKCSEKAEKKAVLVDTLPSVINAPPASEAQVRHVVLRVYAPAAVSGRTGLREEAKAGPTGGPRRPARYSICVLYWQGQAVLDIDDCNIKSTTTVKSTVFVSMPVPRPPFWRPPTSVLV